MLSRCRNVSVNLDGISNAVTITLSLRIPVVEYATVDVSVSEVNLVNLEKQLHIDRSTIVLVDEANNCRDSLLVQTLAQVSSLSNSNQLSISSSCHVTGISIVTSQVFLTHQVPDEHVSRLIPVVTGSCIVMRCVPYTTEPVVVGSELRQLSHGVVISQILSIYIVTLRILIVTLCHPLISSSCRIQRTGRIRNRNSRRIHIRHVLVVTNYIEVVVLLELLLGDTLAVVQLSQDEVLHL